MDFAGVLSEVSRSLEEGGFRWALVGGVALAALGQGRMTLDLDLVVDAEAQPLMVEFLEAAGYATLHRSPGFSNHVHPEARKGRVDLIYVDRTTGDQLFASARQFEGFGGSRVLVPRPEHLAAMKVSAMKDDPSRTLQEMLDVQFLLRLPGVDRDEVRGYFERQGLAERFDEIVATL